VPKTKPLISVVDDDESMREAIRGLMKSLGYTVEAFPSAEEFLNSRGVTRTSCLIADIQMPGMTGIELHRHLVASGSQIPTILITAYLDDSTRQRALANGVVCYLSKPFDENELLTRIRSSLNISERASNSLHAATGSTTRYRKRLTSIPPANGIETSPVVVPNLRVAKDRGV
jgi:FixJ family two-component response regulator